MTHSIRSILALTILAIVLAACSSAVGAPASEKPDPSEPATPSVQPEPTVEPEPSVEPSEAPVVRTYDGIITMAEMAFSGPGGTIQEALDNGPTGNELPTLVNGVIFRDLDGTIYLADSISDTAVPTFEGPMLKVLNMSNDGTSWDMAYAEDIGLEEANGILFRQNAQVLGFLEIP